MQKRFAQLLLALGVSLSQAIPVSAQEGPCRPVTFESKPFTVCSFDLRKDDLRLFLKHADGRTYGSFAKLAEDLSAQGLTLRFAMNAGMFKEDLSPVGLYIENGAELSRLNSASVRTKPEPNFYKKPNGVFYVEEGRAGILESGAFDAARPPARFATQSGPLLVIHGALHPALIEGSSDRKPRNGVGLSSPTEVHFAIADAPVNFYDFARLFRDYLKCPEALFLDGGSASGLYAPNLGRNDWAPWGGYGPIVGVVSKAP